MVPQSWNGQRARQAAKVVFSVFSLSHTHSLSLSLSVSPLFQPTSLPLLRARVCVCACLSLSHSSLFRFNPLFSPCLSLFSLSLFVVLWRTPAFSAPLAVVFVCLRFKFPPALCPHPHRTFTNDSPGALFYEENIRLMDCGVHSMQRVILEDGPAPCLGLMEVQVPRSFLVWCCCCCWHAKSAE